MSRSLVKTLCCATLSCIFTFCLLLSSILLGQDSSSSEQPVSSKTQAEKSTKSQIKVLSYNILEGLQHSRVQIGTFVEWVVSVNPDITFYQELNGFDEKEFAELAKRCGHPYSAKINKKGYRMGISSKTKLFDVQRVTKGLRHGYVYARTLDYHLFAIHLDPFQEATRLKELDIILEHIKTLPKDAKIMIVGDFNSLAESDDATYKGTPFFEKRLSNQKGVDSIYLVTNKLLQEGFIDGYKIHHNQFKKSFFTKKIRIPNFAHGSRIDYAFLSPSLAKDCTSFEIIHDKITDYLSDHYPLVFTFKRSDKEK